MMVYDLIIIGAGCSGLMLAANLDRKINCLILEQNQESGKKLLRSGGARCNLSNQRAAKDLITAYNQPRFVKNAIYNFSYKALKAWFEARSCPLYSDENLRVFPKTNQAKSIRDCLLKANPYEIKYNCQVERIDQRKELITVKTRTGNFTCQELCLAIGSPAAVKKAQYQLFSSLHLAKKEFRPGLAGLKTKQDLSQLAGISLKDVIISPPVKRGAIVFSHQGITGPAALNISSYLDLRQGNMLKLNFLPWLKAEELDFKIREIKASSAKSSLVKTLVNLAGLPHRLVCFILDQAKISLLRKLADLSKKEMASLKSYCFEFPLEITALAASAHIACGGIRLDSIDPKTMRSKEDTRIFCLGEVLDVNGDSGGYNIHFAFASALLAAKELNNKSC